ncbi:MAG: LD-carboxypeptidase [Bdellovibrionaceae bacterium]|nr:LD-carboxypeptidase [Pseudobdellovibrionaceae bacterium]
MSSSLSSYFHKNAIVDIIAPASLCSVSEIKKSIEYVKRLGLEPRFNKNLLKKQKGVLNSQPLAQKEQELKEALLSKDSNIVWCLRGGYGSFKLLPFLSKIKQPKQKKLLIGYSDITALHYFFNQKWKWPSLHFSGIEELSTFFSKHKTQKPGYLQFIRLIKNKKVEYKHLTLLNPKSITPSLSKKLNKPFKKNICSFRSVVIGGNLCTLASLLGSDTLKTHKISAPSFQSILFLEDLNEPAYKIDRMLYQLKAANYFKNIKAIILGNFISSNLENKKINTVFKEFSQTLSIPVLKGLKVGHGPVHQPLAFMSPVNLTIDLNNLKSKTSIKLSYL